MKENKDLVRIDRELYARVRQLHEDSGRTIVHIINQAVQEYLERVKNG